MLQKRFSYRHLLLKQLFPNLVQWSRQQGHLSSKMLLQRDPPVLNCGFQLTQVDLCNGCETFVMAALCNRAGHYIFALWFLSSIYVASFFPCLISAAAGWMSTIL